MEIATNCTREFCQIRKGYMLTCASNEARFCNRLWKPKKHWLLQNRNINNNENCHFKVRLIWKWFRWVLVKYSMIIFGFEYWTVRDSNIVGVRSHLIALGAAMKTKGTCALRCSPPCRCVARSDTEHHHYHWVQQNLSVPSTTDKSPEFQVCLETEL